jgi:hypothetical protein
MFKILLPTLLSFSVSGDSTFLIAVQKLMQGYHCAAPRWLLMSIYIFRGSVGIATVGWTAGIRLFSSPQRPDELWTSPSLLFYGYRGLLDRGVKQPKHEADHSQTGYGQGAQTGYGPTQPLIHWYWEAKRQGREADSSPPSNAEAKNGGAVPPFPHTS